MEETASLGLGPLSPFFSVNISPSLLKEFKIHTCKQDSPWFVIAVLQVNVNLCRAIKKKFVSSK